MAPATAGAVFLGLCLPLRAQEGHYTVTAPDLFAAPYFSFLLERTPNVQPAEPRSWRKWPSTRNDAGRTLQLPLRQLPEGVRNGAARVEGDRGVADGFPAESLTDRVHGAIGEEARHPSPSARAPSLVG